jgi:hypothetical protein
MEFNERHVRVHELDVRGEEGVAKGRIWDGERAFLPEVAYVFDGHARV